MTRANRYVGQAGGLDGSCASLSTGEPGGTPGGEGHGTSADVRTRVSLHVEGPGGFGGGRSGGFGGSGWGGPDGLAGDSNEVHGGGGDFGTSRGPAGDSALDAGKGDDLGVGSCEDDEGVE
jgi:hypothetical protein